MKRVHAPDTLAAYLDTFQTLAAANPGVVVLIAFLGAAAFASLMKRFD